MGLGINNLCLGDFFLSDHKYILFNIDFSTETQPTNLSILSRTLNSSSAGTFSTIFSELSKDATFSGDTNDLVGNFNNLCLSALDLVAPLRIKKKCAGGVNSSPWINDDIRSLKRMCRKIERQWKKSKEMVHFTHMKELLSEFNQKVEDARTAYFSNLINLNSNKPKALFAVINTLVNPPPVSDPS